MDKHPELGKTKAELYQQVVQTQGIGSHTQQAQTALLDMMFTELTASLNRNAESANKLSTQLLILNIVMTFAAIIAIVIGGFQLYFQIFR